MSKLSVSLLVILFSLYVVFASATSPVFRPIPNPCRRFRCHVNKTPISYCVKLLDGTIQQRRGYRGHPPCGKDVAFYHPGKCEGISQTKKFLA